jgi:hypothetical protein
VERFDGQKVELLVRKGLAVEPYPVSIEDVTYCCLEKHKKKPELGYLV